MKGKYNEGCGCWKLVLLLGLVFVLWGNDAAQSPPPPAPMIYSPPNSGDLKEFVAKDDHFSVIFPGTPDSKVMFGNGFVATNFKVYRKGSNSIVNVFEYKENIESKISDFIQGYKQEILEKSLTIGESKFPSKILDDREIETDGVKGHEIRYSSTLEFSIVRVFFSGSRIYLIKTDVTNWHILSQYHKDIVAAFEKETSRFFDSFKILK